MTKDQSLQITRSAGVIPQRANSMEGWLDLVNGAGLQLMTAPTAATTTTTLTPTPSTTPPALFAYLFIDRNNTAIRLALNDYMVAQGSTFR